MTRHDSIILSILLLITFFSVTTAYGNSMYGRNKFLQWRDEQSLMLWRSGDLPSIGKVVNFQAMSDSQHSIENSNNKAQKKITVAIDPGHGGEDKGAHGQDGYKEKNIVLELAQETLNILRENSRIYPFLIRKGDYFLSIKHRCKIAHYNKADLLVSIHANANADKSVQGTSVYYLSRGGASDRASELIASRENASDLIEGFSYSENYLLDTIIVDLMQEHSLTESKYLGKILIDSIVEKTNQKNLGLLSANFGVLKVPDIPSVLVETAFITNEEEEERLADPLFQKKLAGAIADAVMTYVKRFK